MKKTYSSDKVEFFLRELSYNYTSFYKSEAPFDIGMNLDSWIKMMLDE